MAELLRADVVLEMPPFLTWFAGRDAVAGFVGSQLLTAPGADRLVPVTANGQAAFAVYRRDEHGVYRAHALQVLTLTATGIARIVAFADPGRFTSFGLPRGGPGRAGADVGDSHGGADQGLELPGSAVGYARASTAMVTPQLLPRPTPCPAWDRAMLLGHITDSAVVWCTMRSAPAVSASAGRRGIRPGPAVARAAGPAARPFGRPARAVRRSGSAARPRPAPVTNPSPFSAAGCSAAIPRGPPGLHK